MTNQFFLDFNETDKIMCVLDNELENNVWVICSHGILQDKCESWYILSKLSAAISQSSISVCRYDSRGCGDSTNQATNLNIEMFIEDLDFIVKYIKCSFNPSKIILLGVGLGSYAVTSIVETYSINAIILINPTFNSVFNFEQAFSDKYKKVIEEKGYVDMTRSAISNKWLDKLYESGIEYENILGQRVSTKLLKQLSSRNIMNEVKKFKMLKSLYILSSQRKECLETCKIFETFNPQLELKIINSDPLFSHPKVQDEIVDLVKNWVVSL